MGEYVLRCQVNNGRLLSPTVVNTFFNHPTSAPPTQGGRNIVIHSPKMSSLTTGEFVDVYFTLDDEYSKRLEKHLSVYAKRSTISFDKAVVYVVHVVPIP